MIVIILVAVIVPIWWFWLAHISLETAVMSTAICALFWPFFRRLLLSEDEMMVNVFARAAVILTSFGTLNGVVSIIFRLIFR